MAYIAPNFKINKTENVSINFLEAKKSSELEISGYQERELLGNFLYAKVLKTNIGY